MTAYQPQIPDSPGLFGGFKVTRGLHSHAHADSSLLQFSVELLSFTIAVVQFLFTTFTGLFNQKCNHLKAPVIIYSYNHHVGSFLPSLGRQATKVYSGRGADILMKSCGS